MAGAPLNTAWLTVSPSDGADADTGGHDAAERADHTPAGAADGVPAPPESDTVFADRGDNRCGIKVARQFVSPAEIKHLLALVERTGGWKASETGGVRFEVPRGTRTGGFARSVNADPIVRRVEERIASATGIPVHPDEDMLHIARIRPRDSSIRGGNYPPFGLHHESDTRPNRARTVLVYLRAPERGGRTVFPLCGTASPNAAVMERRRFFESALAQQWGEAPQGYARHAGFDPTMEHPFNDFLADACRGKDGYASSPRTGSAIMFDSAVPGTADPYNLTWHAGCNVVEGTKIILQKFKELPFGNRKPSYASYRRAEIFPYTPS